jgi:hypothetical protein
MHPVVQRAIDAIQRQLELVRLAPARLQRAIRG